MGVRFALPPLCERGAGGAARRRGEAGARCRGPGKWESAKSSSLGDFHCRPPPRVQGQGSPSARGGAGLQESGRVAGFRLYPGEAPGAVQVLESPKDARPAAAAAPGRRGRAGPVPTAARRAPGFQKVPGASASVGQPPPHPHLPASARLRGPTPSGWRWRS